MWRLATLGGLAACWLIAPYGVYGQSSARVAGYLYLSPVPGAEYVSPQTRYVLLRFASIAPGQVTNLTTEFVTVNGSASGLHSGAVRVASDNRTVLFQMGEDFVTNEIVTVTLNPQVAPVLAESLKPFEYQFTVATPVTVPTIASSSFKSAVLGTGSPIKTALTVGSRTPRAHPQKSLLFSNGVSVPSDFPQVVITVNSNPSPGYLFLENAMDGCLPIP